MTAEQAPADAPWMCSACSRHSAECRCAELERAHAAAAAEARVFEDHLREAGIERVTLFHVRCLESFFAARLQLKIMVTAAKRSAQLAQASQRLESDVRSSLDELHVQAQWEEVRRMAERSRCRHEHWEYATDLTGATWRVCAACGHRLGDLR